MVRNFLIVFTAGMALSAAFSNDAQAQRRDDDRYFFLRDPFGRGRALFDFPDRPPPPRKVIAEPPSDDPTGTVYGSTQDADQQRFLNASEYVVVLGDTVAEQLSQGLADEFVAERPEVAVIKKTKINTGFVRSDVFDWTAQVSGLLAKEKATALVVLLGVNDRQPLRDETGPQEFRSDKWREIYGKRVEDFLMKLKDKNVPIFVVGLPPVRSPKMSLDNVYINEILSERTRKVGGYYIDAWDGFVAENGDFVATGPALDGQTRRLRANDGVHFTKAGQRKLAHYVERELVRLFDSRPGRTPSPLQGAQPDVSAQPAVPSVSSAARPVTGPILPLSQIGGAPGSALAGGTEAAAVKVNLPAETNASRTLVEGRPVDPVAGRADDFKWPRAAATELSAPAIVPMEPAATTDTPAENAPSTLRPIIAEPKNMKRVPQPAR